jgi:putative protein kinase ArgK-like GTPase of G3E family
VTSIPELARALRAGDRNALARGITLVESRKRDDEPDAEALLEALRPHTGGSARVGVTGAPGVGKSTLIEACAPRAGASPCWRSTRARRCRAAASSATRRG